MIPYLVAFALSSIFVGLGASRLNIPSIFKYMFAMFGVLVVGLLAGIRDLEGVSAGTDVNVYGNPVFNGIADSPTWDIATQIARAYGFEGEVGYVWLNFVVSRVTTDPHVFYGVVASISASLVVVVIMMFRDDGSPVLMWITYLCFSYVDGFNLLRQGIAMSFVLLGVALLLKKRHGWGVLAGLSALLFHNSAFVFAPMALAIWYVKTRRKNVGLAVVLVVASTALVVVAASSLLDLLGGVLSDTKYADYIGEGARRGTVVGLENLYRALPLVLGWGILWARRKRSATPGVLSRSISVNATLMSKEARGRYANTTPARVQNQTPIDVNESMVRRRTAIILLTLLTIEIVMLPIREISYPLYRIPLYFGYVRIIGYAVIVAQFTKYRALVSVGAAAFVLFYFSAMVVGRDGLVYNSEILRSWIS